MTLWTAVFIYLISTEIILFFELPSRLMISLAYIIGAVVNSNYRRKLKEIE